MSVTYTTMNGVILHENRGGTERDYMPDTMGNTAAVLNSSQAKAASWKYWPYGEIRATGGSSPTRFLYGGTLGYRSDDSGRAYIRARELDEKKARWMQVDPMWPEEVAYPYAHCSPSFAVDPSGRFAFAIPLIIGGGAVASFLTFCTLVLGAGGTVYLCCTYYDYCQRSTVTVCTVASTTPTRRPCDVLEWAKCS